MRQNNLKVWVKTEKAGNDQTREMNRYEINCHADKLRITTSVEYDLKGRVERNRSWKNPDWDEVIPDSVGERIVETVCRKTL